MGEICWGKKFMWPIMTAFIFLFVLLPSGSLWGGCNLYAEELPQEARAAANISVSAKVEQSSQTLQIELYDIESTNEIAKVIFTCINSSEQEVYSIEGSYTEQKYTASVDASLLSPAYGHYRVKTTIVDVLDNTIVLDQYGETDLVGATANLAGANPNEEAGSFDFVADSVYISGSTTDFSILVSEKEDSSVSKTYSGLTANEDGTYSVTVKPEDFDYYFGEYEASFLISLSDGNVIEAAKASYGFAPCDFLVYGKFDKSHFTKTLYIYNPTYTSKVYLDVWSKESGKDDVTKYKAKMVENHLEAVIDMTKLKDEGTCYLLIKHKNDKKYEELKKYSFSVTKKEIKKNGWVYETASNGKTYKLYYKNGKKLSNLTSKLKLKAGTKLYIEVNRKKCRVTVYAYDKDTKSWCIPVIAFTCSVGKTSTPTPTGTYSTDRKHRWKELMGPSYGQYATHIQGGIYFHSVSGSAANCYSIKAKDYNQLGNPASHGCVRLTVRDSKWIYDYAALKTKVKIYDSSYAGPISPQKVKKVASDVTYDPTDPAVK